MLFLCGYLPLLFLDPLAKFLAAALFSCFDVFGLLNSFEASLLLDDFSLVVAINY
jgi:hypothetical protein